MSERLERAYEATFGENQLTEQDYQDQRRRIQEDMVAEIENSIREGWRTQEEGDQLIYDWLQRFYPSD